MGAVASVRVERLQLGVIQVAALGRRPRRVGGDSDHDPVGELPPPVVLQAPSGLLDGPVAMPAAPAFAPQGRVQRPAASSLSSSLKQVPNRLASLQGAANFGPSDFIGPRRAPAVLCGSVPIW